LSEEPTDWVALMVRVRDHQDEEAFAVLFRYFAPRVKAFLIKSGAPYTVAEDCAQDVMATLWQKAMLFDPERASLTTWIFTIARNRRIDVLRKARRPTPEELFWMADTSVSEQGEAAVVVQQESDRLALALTALPNAQRVLIEQAYYRDLSHAEIASQTGLPLGTIKSRIRLALEKLRHHTASLRAPDI
jgi:RNA polymerase sigma factor (sigma-70 family)